MLPVMSLSFSLVVVDDCYFSYQIDNLQFSIISFNNSHHSFHVLNPYTVGPIDIEAYVTLTVLYFLLVKGLQLFLHLCHKLLVYLLV